jgi:hypothetical protein
MSYILSIALVVSVSFNLWQWFRGPRQFNINLDDPRNQGACVREGDYVMVTLGNGFIQTKGFAPDAVGFGDDFSAGDITQPSASPPSDSSR